MGISIGRYLAKFTAWDFAPARRRGRTSGCDRPADVEVGLVQRRLPAAGRSN